MLRLTHLQDHRIARFPPEHSRTIRDQLDTLWAVCGREPDPEEDGFVGYVEGLDGAEDVESAIGCPLAMLEGVHRETGCLIGVRLLGNSGTGITLVCPDDDNHNPQVASELRKLLIHKESRNDREE